jgi:hypothetical protein
MGGVRQRKKPDWANILGNAVQISRPTETVRGKAYRAPSGSDIIDD